MAQHKLTLGFDFGTGSARALLADTRTGEELAMAACPYEHGVIESSLPGTGAELGEGWCLQDPSDYLGALQVTARKVVEEAGVDPVDIVGIGLDFTSCTMLPTDERGTPLCLDKKFRGDPHAWVKLWKHHAAQPEEIYRAILEATAFGTRMILRAMESSGLGIRSAVACGGLPDRNPLFMQILADVTGLEIRIPNTQQASALGAAMLGSVAAGAETGGHASLKKAFQAMSGLRETRYRPNPRHTKLYARLFKEYERLHDYFGRGENPVMKALKHWREAGGAE